MIDIYLPMPPSVNSLWKNVRGKGRVCTKAYVSWKKIAGWELLIQRPKKIEGPYNLTMFLSPLRKGSDLANREKAASDLLKEHGVIQDDSLLRDLRMKWSEDIKPGYVRLLLEPASNGTPV
jgi:crossover junction endodeoxyribonuclease RusA